MASAAPGTLGPLPDLGPFAALAPSLAQAFVGLDCELALVLDAQGHITNVAHGAAPGLASLTADWVGRPWQDTVTPDTQAKVHAILAEVAAQGAAKRRELTLLAPGGGLPLACAALRLGAGGPTLVLGHDLRAVARLQQRFIVAQRDLEQGYQLAIQKLAAPAASSLLGTDAAHAVAQLLPAAAELLGLEAAEPLDGSLAAAPRPAPAAPRRSLRPQQRRRMPRRR